MDIALALMAALLFALGTVLQQRAGMEGEPAGGAGLLVRMARRPVWLAGIAADALGFAAQAVALTIGRLSVVQPLLVASVVFALPLGALISGLRPRRSDVAAAAVVTAAVGLFLLVAAPSGGRADAPAQDWLAAGIVAGAACAMLVLAARTAAPGAKAALLGTATGVLFALSAALTKAVGDRFGLGMFTDWHLYALLLVGYASMTLSQLSLQTGRLAPAVATATAFDPLVSVVLGATLLQESLHASPAGVAVALAAAFAGIAVLTSSRGPVPSAA